MKYALTSFYIITVLLIVACGYRPMAYYANKELGNSVFVELKVNLENPEDSIVIKDIVNEAITSRFHSLIASKQNADTILEVSVIGIKDSIIATDTKGFATFYRVFVDISYSFKKLDKSISYTNNEYYDYAAVTQNPIATYSNRSNAIQEAAKQSIDKFVSKIGYEGAQSPNIDDEYQIN